MRGLWAVLALCAAAFAGCSSGTGTTGPDDAQLLDRSGQEDQSDNRAGDGASCPQCPPGDFVGDRPIDTAATGDLHGDGGPELQTDSCGPDGMCADVGGADSQTSDEIGQGDQHDGGPDDSGDGPDQSDSLLDTYPWDFSGCNGMQSLCQRRLNEVAFVTTHNSMSNSADGFVPPNQFDNITTQLKKGVRGFMLDTHYVQPKNPEYDPTVYLCHNFCQLGKLKLSNTLLEMRSFLEEHPREIIAIIFESYVSAEHTLAAFQEAGVMDLLIEPEMGQPLPTLAQLIESNRRLLVFTDNAGGTYPWYLPMWSWCWDNDWDNKNPDDLNCDVNRGHGDNAFFILNHFMTDPIGKPELAEQINHNPFFLDQAMTCWSQRSHIPNFVTVDFYEIGDVFPVVEALNLAQEAPDSPPSQ